MRKPKNRTGIKNGKLLAIEIDKERTKSGRIYWRCLCDCGNYTSVSSMNFDRTKSCGCTKIKDLTGLRNGRLTIIKRGRKNKSGSYYWICDCDCGVTKEILYSSLHTNGTTSCGCDRVSVNHDYWKILNNINCYYAGFIAADGNISKNNDYWQMALANEDKVVLESIVKEINFIGKIHPVYSDKHYIRIQSKKMVKDLRRNFNIIPNKSLILTPPNITKKEHIYPFISGYIDGDGCISVIQNGKRLSLEVIGTKEVTEWIKKQFVDIICKEESKKKYLYTYKKGNQYCFKVYNKMAYNILQELSTINAPRLNRKWDKVKEFK